MFGKISPLTGIIEEDMVVIDFGAHAGKSVLEIADDEPEFYKYLIEKKDCGMCSIKRHKDKVFRLYISRTLN